MDRFFELSERGSTVGQEIRGGLTTFMAMAYIILLNPIILGGATDVTGAKLSIRSSPRRPPGGGGQHDADRAGGQRAVRRRGGTGPERGGRLPGRAVMTWPQAMGLVVLEGLLIIVLAASGLRRLIMNASRSL